MSKVGFAACSTLTLGCVCLAPPGPGACTGGGPLDLIDKASSFSPCETGFAGAPPDTCLAPCSFRGGVGACSVGAAAGVVADSVAPSGPRGSAESSTGCNIVDWAMTFRAGGFRPVEGLDGAEEEAVLAEGLFVSDDTKGGVRSCIEVKDLSTDMA